MNYSVLLQILNVIDDYLKLILTSWLAVVLILISWVLLWYKEEIREFIKRIKSLGPHGADSYPPPFEEKPTPREKREPPMSLISIIKDKFVSLFRKKKSPQEKFALVEYKITHALPGTVVFDFLKD